jgi:hypothetical protein
MANLTASPQIADYAPTVGATRAGAAASDGLQPGDPAKAAALVLAALDADEPPLRLTLGADALDQVLGHLDRVRADLDAWDKRARATTFDD